MKERVVCNNKYTDVKVLLESLIANFKIAY